MRTKEQIKEYKRLWHLKNRQRILVKYSARAKRERLEHPEKVRKYWAEWRNKNRVKIREYHRAWTLKNLEKVRSRKRQDESKWRKNNRDESLQRNRRCYKRRRNDPSFRIECSLRARLVSAIRSSGVDKTGSTKKLLGCSISSFKKYIESLFEVGMTWDNYGNQSGCWSIDHIVPCSLFDLSKPIHQEYCFHFSNLRPMWHIENVKKFNHITEQNKRWLESIPK